MTTVSTSAFYERSNLQLGTLRRSAEKLQGQIGSGERLARSSDDPVAAARLRDLSRQERLTKVDTANSDRATSDLRLADAALSEVANIVIRTRELATQASNSTLGDSDRALIGAEIDQLRQGLLTLSNARDVSGHSLFGGEEVGKAYTESAGTITYQGTGTPPLVDLGAGQSVERGLIGPDIFAFDNGGTATDLFETLDNLAAGLSGGSGSAITASNDALTALEAGLEKVTTSQTIIGSRMGFVETIAERRDNSSLLIADEQAKVGGADLASTISRLQETLTVLEASQASFVRLSSISLFSLLR